MSTKKKRKPPKPRQPSTPPKFSVGDQVRVMYGVADPDFPDIPLGGWAGTINEIDQRERLPLFLVEWNQFTLDNMHPVFRKRCERDGLEETRSWLGEGDLEADTGEPVPLEQPTSIVVRPLNKGDQDDRIRAIFELTSDDPLPEANGDNLLKYHEYLAAHLSFPFQATYCEEIGPFESRKHQVNVVGLVDAGDYYPGEGHGLLCEIQPEDDEHREATTVIQRRVTDRGSILGFLAKVFGFSAPHEEPPNDEDNWLPLDEMEVKKDNPNRRLLADYSYWLHNH